MDATPAIQVNFLLSECDRVPRPLLGFEHFLSRRSDYGSCYAVFLCGLVYSHPTQSLKSKSDLRIVDRHLLCDVEQSIILEGVVS